MKTILITGASSGIGKACAEKLATGNHMILCSRNLNALKSIVINSTYSPRLFEVDVQNSNEVELMFSTLATEGLFPDVVINSAGLAIGLDKIDESAINEWDQMIDTNIKGLLFVSKFALKHMKEKDVGHIINIGSIAGIESYPKGVVYAATKSAVKSISDGLRKEVVEHNIKITNIQPGLVETNFSNIRFGGDENKAKAVYHGIKPLSAEDVAGAIAYVVNTPQHVQINEITLTPTHQASVGVVYKNL